MDTAIRLAKGSRLARGGKRPCGGLRTMTDVARLIAFHLSTFFGAFVNPDNAAILLSLWTALALFAFGLFKAVVQRGREALPLAASPLLSLALVPFAAYYRDDIADPNGLFLILSAVQGAIFLTAALWGRRIWGSILLLLPLIAFFWISALSVAGMAFPAR